MKRSNQTSCIERLEIALNDKFGRRWKNEAFFTQEFGVTHRTFRNWKAKGKIGHFSSFSQIIEKADFPKEIQKELIDLYEHEEQLAQQQKTEPAGVQKTSETSGKSNRETDSQINQSRIAISKSYLYGLVGIIGVLLVLLGSFLNQKPQPEPKDKDEISINRFYTSGPSVNDSNNPDSRDMYVELCGKTDDPLTIYGMNESTGGSWEMVGSRLERDCKIYRVNVNISSTDTWYKFEVFTTNGYGLTVRCKTNSETPIFCSTTDWSEFTSDFQSSIVPPEQ